MIGLGYLRRFADTPEVNVAVFGFLLNHPWEFLQVPLFEGMADAPHWQAVKSCTRAALGDAAILVVAFWGIAATTGSRLWVLRPRLGQVMGFVGIGLEWRSARWSYGRTQRRRPSFRSWASGSRHCSSGPFCRRSRRRAFGAN